MQSKQEPANRRQSFSAFDNQGDEIKGVVLASHASALLLVQQDDADVIWIVDSLDDVGVSLDADQAEWLLPRVANWLAGHGRAVGPNATLVEALFTLRHHLQKQPDVVRLIDTALSAAQEQSQ